MSFPLKEGLRLYAIYLGIILFCVEMSFPLKEGLRLRRTLMCTLRCIVEMSFPLKEGLRQIPLQQTLVGKVL